MNEKGKSSIIQIIHRIHAERNEQIRDLLINPNLKIFVKEHFKSDDIPEPISKLIEQELRSLMISHLDLDHYSGLITQIDKNPNTIDTLAESKLFKLELLGLLKKYFLRAL